MPLPEGTYEMNVFVTLGVWVKRSGAWQRVTQVQGSAYEMFTSPGNRYYHVYYEGSLQLGGSIEAFGVTIDAVQGGTGNVIELTRVQWTAQGTASGTRTALPNSSTTTITVRPK